MRDSVTNVFANNRFFQNCGNATTNIHFQGLRIRIQDPVLFATRSGIRIRHVGKISESYKNIWIGIFEFLDADPAPGSF